jgi:hypothetical protein
MLIKNISSLQPFLPSYPSVHLSAKVLWHKLFFSLCTGCPTKQWVPEISKLAPQVQRIIPLAIVSLSSEHHLSKHTRAALREQAPCSLGLSATSQQYFSLRTNQPSATSQNQPAVLFSQNKPAPAISHQPEQAVWVLRWEHIQEQMSTTESVLNNDFQEGTVASIKHHMYLQNQCPWAHIVPRPVFHWWPNNSFLGNTKGQIN